MNIKVYVKNGCPWCIELEAMLNKYAVKFERLMVTENPELFHEMQNISDQDKAPVVVIDGKIFPNTDKTEIKAYLLDQNIIIEEIT